MIVLIIVIAGAVSSRVIEPPDDRVSVAATIFPIADIVTQVAGDVVDVELVLDPGASPHTFELTPQKASRLANVDIVFAIGFGLDDWATQVASISGSDVVELNQYVELDCAGVCDPHYWLSMPNAIGITNSIVEKLVTLDPEHADIFAQNAEEYITELEVAQGNIDSIFMDAPSHDLVVFHDSWNYFANAYGLNIRGTFEPAPGREPTPKQLAELQNTIKEFNIQSIYREPQLSESALAPFVKDLDIQIRTIDPLGGVEGRLSYIDLMLYNAHAIASP